MLWPNRFVFILCGKGVNRKNPDSDNWQWEANPMKKLDFGKWELILPPRPDGMAAIDHLSEVKVIIRTQSGQLVSRLSPWAKYVVQPPKELNQGTNFKQIVWNPPPHEVIVIKIV